MTNIEDAQENSKSGRFFEEKDSRSAQKTTTRVPDEFQKKKQISQKSFDFFLRESEIFLKKLLSLIPLGKSRKFIFFYLIDFFVDWKFDHGLVHLASSKKSLWQKILESLSWIQSTSRPVLVLLDNIV